MRANLSWSPGSPSPSPTAGSMSVCPQWALWAVCHLSAGGEQEETYMPTSLLSLPNLSSATLLPSCAEQMTGALGGGPWQHPSHPTSTRVIGSAGLLTPPTQLHDPLVWSGRRGGACPGAEQGQVQAQSSCLTRPSAWPFPP